jgi:2-iminoacetate synthase ThiH
VSVLVDRAIRDAGLVPLVEARARGDMAFVLEQAALLDDADLLALGALANRLRTDEVGDVVRIHANAGSLPLGSDAVDVRVPDARGNDGYGVLRSAAIARILGPKGARVRLDWSLVGLEIAQVALGFGVSELVGPLATKRGLPIAEDATKKVKGAGMVAVQALKRKELCALIRQAGRVPVFADGERPRATSEPGAPEPPHA